MKQPGNPFASEEITAPFNDEWQAKRRVAQALKQLTEVLVTSTPPIAELHAIADSLEQTATRFATYPRLYGRTAFMEEGSHGSFGQLAHELNPLAGLSNPLAPPINMWIKDGRAVGRVTMGWAYEGPPGTVHGGYVAAIFDQFLGMAQVIGKQPGMTGTLTIRYHLRTPLNTELHLEAWIEQIEGRKTRVCGEIHVGDSLTASCEGIFIQPRGGMRQVRPLQESAPGEDGA
jgi:acyl-coenzyme A thioesterase PaaI-like protein